MKIGVYETVWDVSSMLCVEPSVQLSTTMILLNFFVCRRSYGSSHARVYVYILWLHAVNRALEHQCMCSCVCFDKCLLTLVYIFVSTLSAGYHMPVHSKHVPGELHILKARIGALCGL